MRPTVSHIASAALLSGLLLLLPAPGAGQEEHVHHEASIQGRVVADETGEPLPGTLVSVVGLRRSQVSHADGHFHLENVPPGLRTLRVERLGYRTVTRELEVPEEGLARVEIRMESSPIDVEGLVVTGAISERGADETIRPVNVVSGEELQRRLGETVGATLESEPGVAVGSMGPATAKPVIRGLSGDRVLMLEDGERVGDTSNSGSDHGSALDPASARRIEVVRGPAALLYGSNALGGVVNVIRDEVPAQVPAHPTGSATVQGRTVNGGWAGSGHVRLGVAERIPLRLELTGRTAGDMATPVGDLENTGIESWNGSVGSSWVGAWGYAGASFRYYRNDYGIPGGFVGGHEDGVRVEMERRSTKLRAVVEEPGPFSSLEVDGVYTWYRHTEIESPDIVGTIFGLRTLSGDVLARHEGWGPFSAGAAGVRASWEDFGFGGSLFTPDSRRYTVAGYLFEERELGPLTLEGGLRWDWVRTEPTDVVEDSDIGDVRSRTFDALSGSLGALWRVGGGVSLGASAARAFRTPDVNELYSEGPHLAAFSFEVGNPDLGVETGLGVDAFLRFTRDRVSAELTAFHNDIDGYVYPRETGGVSRTGLPVFQFRGEDAVLEGLEGRVQWEVARGLVLDGTGSWVRGTLTATDEPLPFMPPLNGRVGLEYETTVWTLGGEVELAAEQDRLGAFETPTDGYAVFNLSAGVRATIEGRLNVLTVSLDNLTNEVYRNHLSRVKEIMPEAGRGLTVTYRVVF